jgi:hypothetical protein
MKNYITLFFQTLSKILKADRKPSFGECLETFKNLGFTLNPGVTIEDIREICDPDNSRRNPYEELYSAFGKTIEREPWTPICNKCWDFDTEFIEGNGSYIEILKNVSRLTNGELGFENLQDHVDIQNKSAWVSFRCNGEDFKWDLKVKNDWADETLFSKIQELAVKNATQGRFTYYQLFGQDFVLGFLTPEEFQKFRNDTGLASLKWLK